MTSKDYVEAIIEEDGSAYEVEMEASYRDKSIYEYMYDLFEPDFGDELDFEIEIHEAAQMIIAMLEEEE